MIDWTVVEHLRRVFTTATIVHALTLSMGEESFRKEGCKA